MAKHIGEITDAALQEQQTSTFLKKITTGAKDLGKYILEFYTTKPTQTIEGVDISRYSGCGNYGFLPENKPSIGTTVTTKSREDIGYSNPFYNITKG